MHVFGKDSSCSLFMWEVSWIFNSQKFVYMTQIDYQVWNRCQYMKESFLERMIQKSLWIQRRGMSKSVSPSDIFLCPWLQTNDFLQRTISQNSEQAILLNKLFHWTNDFTANKRFHLTNDFTEQTISLDKWFHWTSDFTEGTISLNEQFHWTNYLTEQTISLNKWFHCKQTISLNERFHWTSDFSERKIWLNKRFQWTNDFSKRTKDFSEQTNSLNER